MRDTNANPCAAGCCGMDRGPGLDRDVQKRKEAEAEKYAVVNQCSPKPRDSVADSAFTTSRNANDINERIRELYGQFGIPQPPHMAMPNLDTAAHEDHAEFLAAILETTHAAQRETRELLERLFGLARRLV